MIAFIGIPEKIDLLPNELIKTTSYELIYQMKDIHVLVSKLKNATHYTKIIIDVSLFDNEQDDILKALFLLKAMSNTHIIIISQGSSLGDYLLSELVRIGIYNFVLSWIKENAKVEMLECLNDKQYQDVAHYIVEETIEKKSRFKIRQSKDAVTKIIQVIGVCPRIGATTQSIKIAKSLIEEGYRACYVEMNRSGHLNVIKTVFSEAKAISENTVVFSDLPLCAKLTDEVLKSYEFIVCDYGSDFTPEELCETNKTIVVTGSKAWEMLLTPPLMELTSEYDDTRYLFSFTDKREREDVLDFVGEKWTATFFAEYSPDMFSAITETEKSLYKKLVFGSKESSFSLIKKRGISQ